MASFHVVADRAGWVTLAGDGIAFVTGGVQDVPTVDVMAPGDVHPRVIFTGPDSTGLVEALAGGSHYLTWTYEPVQQDDPLSPVPWTIYSYDLRTGRTKTLASSASGSPFPPWPVRDGSRVAWANYNGTTNLADIYVGDLVSGTSRDAVRRLKTDQIALSGKTLVYSKTYGRAPAPKFWRTDLVAVDLTTGSTRRLTHTGNVELPVVSGRWLTWQEGKDSGAMRLPDGNPMTLRTHVQGQQEAGDGFAAYIGTRGIDAIALASGARPVAISRDASSVCNQCGISIQGSRMAWGTSHGTSNRITITVDSVTRR